MDSFQVNFNEDTAVNDSIIVTYFSCGRDHFNYALKWVFDTVCLCSNFYYMCIWRYLIKRGWVFRVFNRDKK